ncbi:hypothetical protein R1flu_007120 [Riccia fluitans]|uniref:Uncharacterized protein n=1 Tax=Riccia fluitans TaxID=41844 RepID=A0ABD1YXY1_9MARC
MKITSSYICRLLLSSVVYTGPSLSISFEIVAVRVSWTNSLVRLQQCVNDEITKTRNVRKCTFMLLNEVEVLESALGELRAQLNNGVRGHGTSQEDAEKIRQHALSFKQFIQKFQTGVETFYWHVNDLFDEIVEGRNKLLNLVSS